MGIAEGQYVEISSGEIFWVAQNRKEKVVLKNIRSGEHKTWLVGSVKPICVQVGDEVMLGHSGTRYELEKIVYKKDMGRYEYIFYSTKNSMYEYLTQSEFKQHLLGFVK